MRFFASDFAQNHTNLMKNAENRMKKCKKKKGIIDALPMSCRPAIFWISVLVVLFPGRFR